MWTFGRKIASAFLIFSLLLLVIGAVAYRNLSALTTTSDAVTRSSHTLQMSGQLTTPVEGARSAHPAFGPRLALS